jgi:hypothetical protein
MEIHRNAGVAEQSVRTLRSTNIWNRRLDCSCLNGMVGRDGCGLSVSSEQALGCFGCCYIHCVLLPVLNLFPITTLMNDRYLYLPSIPFFVLTAAGLYRFSLTLKRPEEHSLSPVLSRGFCFAVALCLVITLAWRTREHLPVWKNDFALWGHANQHVPHLTVVQIQRASAFQRKGDKEQAVALLESALLNSDPDAADRKRILKKLADWQH